mgnify:CR=1 FL=1|tara:strand:- start:9726 stop:10367 length:642 start_codon:yes stop_codon:yes gene_type:complete
MRKIYQKYKYIASNPYRDYNDETESIFIHIPKTAGISVSKSIYGENKGHTKLLHYQRYDEERFDRYYKFAFVRNPWDRFVSAFYYLKKGGRNQQDKSWAAKYLMNGESLNGFIERINGDKNFRRDVLIHQHFEPQINYLKDKSGNLNIDFIGRFENLNDDFQKIANHLQISAKLKEININKEKDHYKTYYNDKTKEIIERLYAEDIIKLNYQW